MLSMDLCILYIFAQVAYSVANEQFAESLPALRIDEVCH